MIKKSLNQTATESEKKEQAQPKAIRTSQQKVKVHWNENLTIHALQPCEAICQRPFYKRDGLLQRCICGTRETGLRGSDSKKQTEKVNEKTQKSIRCRDGLTDVVITMHKLGITKNNDDPNCPPPKNRSKRETCLCSICYNEVELDEHTLHIVCPTTNNQTALKSGTAILQRPKQTEICPSTNTPSKPPPKTLQQRQEEYVLARAQIFDTRPTIAPIQNKIYKHPNHASRNPKQEIKLN